MDYVCSSKLPEMWNINHLKNNLPGKPYIFNMFVLGVLEGIPYMVSENIPLWGIAEKRNMVRLKINHIYLYIYYIYVYVPIIPQIGIRYTPVLSTIPSFINGTWYLKRCVDFLYPISSPTWAFWDHSPCWSAAWWLLSVAFFYVGGVIWTSWGYKALIYEVDIYIYICICIYIYIYI